MSRILKRISGSAGGGAFADGDQLKLTPHIQPLKDDLDLLMLGVLGRNRVAGGDLIAGFDASAAGDVDLMNWTPFIVDNTATQLSAFTDANGATLVVACRFLLRVSGAAISLTPKILYGATIAAITNVATISGQAATTGIATDFSGTNQYQTVLVTLPSGVNIFKPQVTIGGTPAAGLQGFARAWWDVYVQS